MKDTHNKKITPIKFTKKEIDNFIALARILKKVEIRKRLDAQYESLQEDNHLKT